MKGNNGWKYTTTETTLTDWSKKLDNSLRRGSSSRISHSPTNLCILSDLKIEDYREKGYRCVFILPLKCYWRKPVDEEYPLSSQRS